MRVGGKPLLRIAAELGHRDICELLVEQGADVNETMGVRKHSILHNAVSRSDYGTSSILLDLGADPNVKASNEATPLQFAARSGQVYLAAKLLNHGAKVDGQDNQGRSALHWAAEKSDFDMVKFLLKHNCDANLADRRGRTPLSIAFANGSHEIAELLEKYGGKYPESKHARRLSKVAEAKSQPRQM